MPPSGGYFNVSTSALTAAAAQADSEADLIAAAAEQVERSLSQAGDSGGLSPLDEAVQDSIPRWRSTIEDRSSEVSAVATALRANAESYVQTDGAIEAPLRAGLIV